MAVTISNYGSLFTNVLYEQILLNEGSEFHEVYIFFFTFNIRYFNASCFNFAHK